MSLTTRITPVRTDIDGLAVIGMTPNDIRGIRYETDPGGNTPPAGDPAPDPAPTADPAPAGDPKPAEKVEDLPAWAQKIITDTRKEAGDHRAAAKTAAQTAQTELSDKIAVALGLKPDAATDPAALTASLTKAQEDAKTAARELAVFKAANGLADPSRLLDRTSFTTSIAGIDPTDGPAIKAAIEAAVAADVSLKAARAAGASSLEIPGGTGEQGQITEAQLAQMTPEQISTAFDKGQLKHLLG